MGWDGMGLITWPGLYYRPRRQCGQIGRAFDVAVSKWRCQSSHTLAAFAWSAAGAQASDFDIGKKIADMRGEKEGEVEVEGLLNCMNIHTNPGPVC